MARHEKISQGEFRAVCLRDIAVFPGSRLSCEVNEQYERLCSRAESGRELIVAVPEMPDPAGEYITAEYGTLCAVELVSKIPGSAPKVSFFGLKRVKIDDLSVERKAVTVKVTVTDIVTDRSIETDAMCGELRKIFGEMSDFMFHVSDELTAQMKSTFDPGTLADLIASVALINIEDKVLVLAENDPMARAALVAKLLLQIKEILMCQARIHQKVKEAVDNNQKEFVLREQLKHVREELGYNDEEDEEIVEYREKLDATPLPDDVREKLSKEVSKLAKTPYASAESSVIRTYIDTCLELPWGKRTNDRTDVRAAQKILDNDHDGLEKVKERILEYLAVRQLNPDIKNQIICLAGPPGTGKTSIAQSLAHAMKRNYVRISLGGVRDEADIRGHRKTYIGSMPGRIINGIIQSKSMNPLVLLDEIDKLTSDAHGDPSSALLEVLDSEQNKTFVDHFIEFPVDLSECLFICTANNVERIPRPLLDRMEIIELKIYTRTEKLSIAKHHLIPKQMKRHGLDRRKVRITDSAVYEIIDFYTSEAGVRNLEREIASLCRKIAKRIVDGQGEKYTVSAGNVKDYLGVRKVVPDAVYDSDEIGTVNGLAYTEVGGDLLRIEASAMPGTGKLELTGSLGDVMKESARAAYTYIRSHSNELGINGDFYKDKDIHIHVPEGAVPKDGPSAGVSITTALVSELSGRAVRRDIAMTGEITLHGRVLAIGGLKEKTMAAYKAGVKKVFIPADNVKDLSEIDPLVRDNLEFVPCRYISQVLEGAIV